MSFTGTSEVDRLAAELEQSEARFRDIIERNADAIVVVDQEGIIRFANAEAGKLFGGLRGTLVGGSFGFPLVAGETTELDLLTDRGSVIAELRVFESHWEGEPACIASLHDITARKRAEQHARDLIRAETERAAAEEAASRFRFLAESMTILSSSLDLEATLGELARLCVADLADWVVIYGFPENGIQRVEAMHRDPTRADLMRELRQFALDLDISDPVLAAESPMPRLARDITDTQLGTLFSRLNAPTVLAQLGVTSAMLVPMIARERLMGALILVRADAQHAFTQQDLALASDLASRAALALDNARLYAEARQANQAKSELLALISHDLRTPLNSIIGYGQLLQLGIPEALPEVCLERVERMLTSARHQLYLIDGLLHYARLDAGREEVVLQDVQVQDVAREALSLIEPLASERGLAIAARLSDTPLVCRTDPDKLRQVLLNLLGNAVKYTTEGEISLEVRAGGASDVLVVVSDTGIGIAPEDLPHIFEPFWQADRGQRTRGGGTGLGLAVVQQIVHLLDGRIAVDSEPGEGSTFTVKLQRATGPGD